jgi:hypothetical protein
MILLKQSTASQEVALGPFVDATDGVTADTALTINNTDIKIFKAGATALVDKNSGGATHMASGNYSAVLDATDTNTVGSSVIIVQVAGALAVRHDFCVLPAAIYDWLVGGTVTNLPTNVAQWSGTNVATPATAGHPVVTVKVGTGTGELNLSGGNVSIRTGLKKNVGFTLNFTMRDTTGAPLTGSTVTVSRAIDTATSFTTVGTATEKASGHYHIALANSDVNGDCIALRMSGSGGSGTPADNAITLIMEP